jgi:hypothetical protein
MPIARRTVRGLRVGARAERSMTTRPAAVPVSSQATPKAAGSLLGVMPYPAP